MNMKIIETIDSVVNCRKDIFKKKSFSLKSRLNLRRKGTKTDIDLLRIFLKLIEVNKYMKIEFIFWGEWAVVRLSSFYYIL